MTYSTACSQEPQQFPSYIGLIFFLVLKDNWQIGIPNHVHLTALPCFKDISEYWQNNWALAETLQTYWGESAPRSMEKVFPVRFYGDGAETTGINSFELLTMLSVSPKRSSTLKTRFVFLGLAIL